MFVKTLALHRLVQTITWRGEAYTFFRPTVNEYGEKSGEPIEIATFKGLFHNGSSSHIVLTASDSGVTATKNTPYIMTPWGNAKKVQLEDEVIINSKTFKVTGRTNISEANIIAEISLEVVQ